MTSYLLDANVFIQAKNLHYGLDFCPAFWAWLIEKNRESKVASIEKVADEIDAGQDELSDWVNARGKIFFLPPDDEILPALGEVSSWVSSQNYEPAAIATFLQVADYWLVAHAKAHDYVVVTHEVPSDGIRKVKIPNICVGLGIGCISPFEMLRRERARFVLEASKTTPSQ
ncbi:MAG: DUF4411 family protein [Alphaproteobacteria bacterium]|nr:DUF4411 family protein [Alphaproteobacteria bacterium]